MMVLIRGAGDLASGIALRLHRAHFNVVMTDISRPTTLRRTVSFSSAISRGQCAVEGARGVLVRNADEALAVALSGDIAVIVDPDALILRNMAFDALVDAIMARRNTGTNISDAPVVVCLGPGFTAGVDCHAVVETLRGHCLGRVITRGSAAPATGSPGNIGGYTHERLLRAPDNGLFEQLLDIGACVKKGDVVGTVNGKPLICRIDGILRGVLSSGVPVHRGMKSGDVDPRCEIEHCFTVSDKALAVGGGVLEAILHFGGPRRR
ncbi:MAG: EF2563 family selenium-dependent molybdenum hydroxylase system protein [Synergistaceae bacterium]|jgi:xanthine dehydrogenase accessory factor|nr:EF2563 family selenium-dependent molybdenum hydroxylase system protein [Synergistaceae bacterium]